MKTTAFAVVSPKGKIVQAPLGGLKVFTDDKYDARPKNQGRKNRVIRVRITFKKPQREKVLQTAFAVVVEGGIVITNYFTRNGEIDFSNNAVYNIYSSRKDAQSSAGGWEDMFTSHTGRHRVRKVFITPLE